MLGNSSRLLLPFDHPYWLTVAVGEGEEMSRQLFRVAGGECVSDGNCSMTFRIYDVVEGEQGWICYARG